MLAPHSALNIAAQIEEPGGSLLVAHDRPRRLHRPFAMWAPAELRALGSSQHGCKADGSLEMLDSRAFAVAGEVNERAIFKPCAEHESLPAPQGLRCRRFVLACAHAQMIVASVVNLNAHWHAVLRLPWALLAAVAARVWWRKWADEVECRGGGVLAPAPAEDGRALLILAALDAPACPRECGPEAAVACRVAPP